MGKVDRLVRGVVQGTLHRKKPDIMVSVRPKGNDGSLNDAIQELEKIFVDGIGRLKAAVSDDQAVVANKAQHAEQVIAGLKVNITVLEAKLKGMEDTLHRKDIAGQKMEESLSGEIRDLQSVVKKKEEALESRDSEVNDLKSNRDVLAGQVTRLELAIRQAKGEAASEAQHAEQVIAGLKANITVLEAKLKETEDTVFKKDVVNQKMEESLSGEIRDLQSAVKNKEEALKDRDSEVNDLKSKVNVLTDETSCLALAIQQAKAEAASEAKDAEQVIAGLKANIATLEAQLTLPEQPVGKTDGTIEAFYQDRDRQVIDPNAELKPQTNETKEMSAEALANIQAQGIGTLMAPEQLKTSEEKPATSHFQASGVTSIVMQAGLKTVSQHTFDRMIAEFGELTNVIGSIAALIVRDHVRELGESMKEFPQTRLAELVESLSRQITDDKLKADFRKRFGTV